MPISPSTLTLLAAPDRFEVIRRTTVTPSEREVLLCRRIRSDGVAGGYEIIMEEGTPASERTLAIAQWLTEIRQESKAQWDALDLPGQLLNIVTRIWNGEWMGQSAELGLTVGDVVRVRGLSPDEERPQVVVALQRLEHEHQLRVVSGVIYPYADRFHFPAEIRTMLIAMIEDPMGWPNGDAGAGAVERLETAIHDDAGYTHGGSLVWPSNYPHIAPTYLLRFGLHFLDLAIQAHQRGSARVFGSERDRQEAIHALRTLTVTLDASAPAPAR
jgi:hypothetical protein